MIFIFNIHPINTSIHDNFTCNDKIRFIILRFQTDKYIICMLFDSDKANRIVVETIISNAMSWHIKVNYKEV